VLTWARNSVWADPVRVWSEATTSAPHQWESHYALADALREQQRCREAVPEYEAVLKLSPAHRDAANNLGICLAQLEEYDRARAAFQAAIDIDPRFARAYNNLGNLALVAGDHVEARREFARALEYDPGNVTARRQLVAISEADGQYADAVRYCHELMNLLGRTPDLLECIRRNEERLRSAH
jgi:Tfp pilus assembly protein PilF